MEPIAFVAVIGSLIILLLLIGTPLKPLRWIGQACIKLVIGALFLFFLNAAGTKIGLHVPINPATASVAGFLGVPGAVALAAIEYWIL
ncbi:inhibitor of the pro-sigma K processing machinery [Peribacillus deserti]|uniref:Inhibitor of the pro-sigma K processing machinery n=1 Tax=Peribacillus deserti TaxID=673318 RepID=A0ABS2QQ22_9BACI|nr:pro-sigmaK processing inhibitor BofA family protein [Peribacillus deserti]MBM7694789.1 inhibitor of the pro-sigma K processing machinery [Peribacillus deserti]